MCETAGCRGPVSESDGAEVDDPVPGATGVWLVQQPQPRSKTMPETERTFRIFFVDLSIGSEWPIANRLFASASAVKTRTLVASQGPFSYATGRGRSCLDALRIAAEAERLCVSPDRIRCVDI